MSELTRRNFLTLASVTAACAIGFSGIAQAAPAFTLPPLPFANTDLEPVISKTTIDYHYGKHHRGYINKANAALSRPENAIYRGLNLEQLMLTTANKNSSAGLFNSSAQAINHEFYWGSLAGNGGDRMLPTGELLQKINDAFGSFDNMKTRLLNTAGSQFGAGWAWLVQNRQGNLEILSTSNADNPLMWGMKPLLTIDVWEHTYYLDYQNARKTYLKEVIDKLLNWNAVAQRLGA